MLETALKVLRDAGMEPPYTIRDGALGADYDGRSTLVLLNAGRNVSATRSMLRQVDTVVPLACILKAPGKAEEECLWSNPADIATRIFSDTDIVIVPYVANPRGAGLYGLVFVVDRLLGPGGCPWDREQTHESLKKYLLEEAYEVLDAIDSGSNEKLKEELGDLLLQPIMHAQMEKRDGSWSIEEVAATITEKLVRRHPHVFAELEVSGSEQVLKNWDQIKREEKGAQEPSSILSGIPKGMASLLRAHEISKRAARCGFEWPEIASVFEKLHEEEQELREAIQSKDQTAIESEVGDLLFTAVNIARWAGVEPEEALRKMLNRFCERFSYMERVANRPLNELSLTEWDELWERSKANLE